jgi:alpha-L-rhamnosidase
MMDYGMLWVQSLLDYWRLTGDVSLLRDMFPTLLDFMSYLKGYKHSDTGLLSLPKTHWSKTVLIDWLAPHSRYGQSTAVNALYYATLQDASEIARALDKTERGNAWLQEASEIKEQMYDVLYDPEAGCYKETVYVEVNHAYEITTQSAAAISTCSPHAQAWALACEAVPEHMEVPVADALLGGLSRDPTNPNVDIYGIYWVLEALAKTERHSEAISIIEDLYGYLLSRGATTWWEGFSADQHYTASLSHGWGGAPTWYLTSHLLGATRTAPDMWKVAPAYKGLSRASGSLPLSSGDLGVNWRYEGCESFSLGISAPNGSSGSVILSPVREGMTVTVTLNEVVIWQNDEPHDESVTLNSAGLTVDIEEGGEYTFQIDRVCHDIYLPSVASHW